MRPPILVAAIIPGLMSGPIAAEMIGTVRRPMSALHPITTQLVRHDEPTLRADFVAKVVDGSRAE